jgi:lysophospholipase L1-like esterase
VGDSITALSADDIRDLLGGQYRVSLRAVPGARSIDMGEFATQLAAERPTQAVINLGSNDALKGTDLDDTRASLTSMIETFTTARCIHLVTIKAGMVSNIYGDVSKQAEGINALLEELAAGDDRISIIDWAGIVADQPDLVDDTIHPTDEGQRRLVEAIGDALEDCPRNG